MPNDHYLKNHKPIVAACIPALNEERTIADIVSKAKKFADIVIVVDDGSSDNTAIVAEKHGALVIRHERTKGYGAALRSALKKALELDVDIAVTLDADGQHDPAEIPKVIKPIIERKADMVIGSRFLSKKSIEEIPTGRKIGIHLINFIFKFWSRNFNISDSQSGFRAYSKKILPYIIPEIDGMGASLEILLKACKRSVKILEVPIFCKYFKTNMPIRSMLAQGIDAISPLLYRDMNSNSNPLSKILFQVLKFVDSLIKNERKINKDHRRFA